MEIKRKYLFLTILLLGPLVFSCKKQNSDVSEDGTGSGIGNDSDLHTIVPLQMGSGTAKLSFSYDDAQLLSKIDYADGTSAVLLLNSKKQPDMFKIFNGTQVVGRSEYELNEDGLVIGAAQYTYNKLLSVLVGHFTIEYNSKQQPVRIKNYDTKNKLLDERIRTYSSAGNLLSEESSAGTCTYTYDAKNGLFSNAKNSSLFAIETGETLLLSVLNNVTVCSNASNSKANESYSYAYDTRGFPKTISSTKDGKTISTVVSYK